MPLPPRRLTAEKTVETIFAFCITHLIFSCRQAPAVQPCLLRPLGSEEDTKIKLYVILIIAIMDGCANGLAKGGFYSESEICFSNPQTGAALACTTSKIWRLVSVWPFSSVPPS